MKRKLFIALFFSFIAAAAYSQQQTTTINGYMVPVCVYKGDTIPAVQLPNVYIFRPLKFKNEKERREYYRLVRNVKKTLPLAREINRAVIETYEYIETLPDKKAREKHLKLVEKGLKEQYTPIMKKLTFSQGKLLIKLVNRQTDSSSSEFRIKEQRAQDKPWYSPDYFLYAGPGLTGSSMATVDGYIADALATGALWLGRHYATT